MITSRREYEDIDYEELREDLLQLYGPGVTFNPNMKIMIIDIEHADEDELIRIAEESGYDLERYRETDGGSYD